VSERHERLERLFHFQNELFSIIKEKELVEKVVRWGLSWADSTGIGLLGKRNVEGPAELACAYGDFDFARFGKFCRKEFLEEILERRQPALLNGSTAQKITQSQDKPQTFLLLPLICGNTAKEVLVFQRPLEHPFSEQEIELAKLFSQTVGQALHNARAFENLENAYRSVSVAQEQALQTERLRALKEMAAGMAHDFNNVLGTILGRIQLLLNQPLDEKLVHSLKQMEKAAAEVVRKVARLQEFTRDRHEDEAHPVDLTSVAKEAVEVTRTVWRDGIEAMGKAPIELSTDFSAATAPILGNFTDLVEVVANLISNAVDALPSGGKIVVSTFQKGTDVLLSVRDNGIGMSPEVKSKVFFPFYTTKGRKGTGLGLSVAYGIVSSYRGEILIESEPGKGSVFTLRFPASHAPEKQEPPALVEEKVGRLSILAVDDDENIRCVLSEMLDFLGHKVEAAEDGKRALSLLEKQSFDLVITDLGMPGITGWEVARTAKEKDKSTPVILISGWGSQIEPAKVSEVGIDKVLPKPFHMDDIRQAIGEVLAKVKKTPAQAK